MFKFLSAALFAALPLGAVAAPVDSPVIDVPVATGEFVSFGGQGDFLAYDAPATGQGLPVLDGLLADLDLTFDLADPYGTADGAFWLRQGADPVLGGFLSAIAPSEDMLSLTFSDLTGDLAALFGSGLTVELFFFDMLGDDPLAALQSGGSYDLAYVVEGAPQPAPIPLPAGGLLLLTGLGLIAMRRGVRRAA
ncbi:hypothetical protein [uncultured Paracoccus sp.]|uniref:hypothetical protein n=1 Tax=uncultured Paracoccus sp. TaxID=189685 RepID=UPI0025FA0468|nr:hypothetical protein [uncultured Paracoccus sp.]